MIIQHYAHHVADGPTQMAIDDAMLDLAVTGVASLRFYDWREPTLSLGYFQPAAERLAIPALAALPWLRRASGGAAILHGDGDLTYSLALPADKHWHDSEPWLCRFHHILQRAFRKLGLASKAVVCGEEVKRAPVLCFQHHTPGDLLESGIKVVGSAQRKQRGSLLQHGTIRLRQSQNLPELSGLFELSGIEITSESLIAQTLAEFEAETMWTLERMPLPATNENRYRTAEWNEKR